MQSKTKIVLVQSAKLQEGFCPVVQNNWQLFCLGISFCQTFLVWLNSKKLNHLTQARSKEHTDDFYSRYLYKL